MTKRLLPIVCIGFLAGTAAFGCGSDDPAVVNGSGTSSFTTWGEDFIEDSIPAGDDGLVDGWTVKYEKFLVHFSDIKVADSSGKVGVQDTASYFVDNVKPGKKPLATFAGVEARQWDKVSYKIAPALASAKLISGSPEDLAMMVSKGYSLYVEGKGTKGAVEKRFKWGFSTATLYKDCRAEADGKEQYGLIVTNGSTDTAELTTHGDHFFYDRLTSSPDGKPTLLKFQEKADADANDDGEVTLVELDAAPIPLSAGYNPSPFTNVTNLGGFVRQLVRTVGHYRGEGECTVCDATQADCKP